ncbi:MAG: dTDP-4-dehydrorhamnose reductase [Chitinophagaceae bacterium]|nr:dTDP-4-dehydrorhamnose reductase [Chitinophagaceae bacterium]
MTKLMTTKVLLTGASGMLGKMLFKELNVQKRYEVFTVSRTELKISDKHFINDIGDHNQLTQILRSCEPEIVINCAAYVNLDFCEKNQTQTSLLHQRAVSILSSYPSVQSLYYISTDSVFDGQSGNYDEEDLVNPLNYYALSKLHGESETLKKAKNGFIIRTNIFGFNSTAGKSLFEWAYQNLSTGNSINGFTNVFFNPLYVWNLSKMIISFMQMNCSTGIYNFASNQGISKYMFLFKIAEVFGFDTKLIKPIRLDISQMNAMRPLNTTLNTNKINNLGINVPNIDICIQNLYNDFKKDVTRV